MATVFIKAYKISKILNQAVFDVEPGAVFSLSTTEYQFPFE
jgi:hypothetical protein